MKPAPSFLVRLLGLIVVVTVPWVVVIGLDILNDRDTAEAEALRSVQQRSRLLAQEIDDTLQRSRQLLDFLASRPEIVQGDQKACQSLLGGLMHVDPLLANAAFADGQGQILCASIRDEQLPASVANVEEFVAARASKKVVLGAPRWGPVAGRPVLPLVRGVDGPDGRNIGVLVLTLDLQAWSESWRRHAVTEGSTFVLQNSTGLIVARYPEPGRWIGHDAAERLETFRRQAPEGIGQGVGVDGVRRFFATTPLPAWGCTVVAGIPEQAVLAPARTEALRAGVALVLLTLLVGWLAWRLSRRLVAPLQHLAATARAVAEGRPEARADEALPGEFRTVASEFNRMLDSRDRTQARLAESERRFREMLDTVELFAVAADADGRITYCNDFFLQRTGWLLDELTGADFGERCVPPERRAERDDWRQALREGRLQAHTEAAILTRLGERRLVRWSSTMLRDERGVIVGRASIGEDVTDQRRAEAQVQRLSGFLAALSRTQRAIIHRAPRDELLREACDACVDAGQARVASAWLLTPEGLLAQAWAGPAEALFGAMPARLDVDAPGFADSPTSHALRIGLPSISNHLADDAQAGDWRASAQVAGIQAQAVFPLRCGGEIVGVLLLHLDEAGGFDDALVELLHQLSDDLAFALDNLQREQSRMDIQRQAALDHQRFKSMFEASPMGIAVRSLDDGRLLDVNPVFAARVGLSREQLIGNNLPELGLGMQQADHERLLALMRTRGRVRDFEATVRSTDGLDRVILVNGELIDDGGRPAVLTISHDVTARRRAERALAEREQQLAGIVDSAMDAIITIDHRQCIVMFNRAAVQVFRLPAEQALGRKLDEFVPPELLERHRHGIAAFIGGERQQVMIGPQRGLYGLRADGERFPFEAAVSRQGRGDKLTMTAVIHDLTERLAAEAARDARVVAEAASQAKTEFLSRMSHELRTPLNAMLGFAQLLGDDAQEQLSMRQRQYLQRTREAGWHLLALIDDVLDVSRIESGQLDMQLEAVPIAALIESALAVGAALAERHQVRLLPAPPGVEDSVAARADATRLRQVLLNLLSNGCKYNRPGGQVAVELADEGDWLAMAVVDNGVGMSGEQLAHLFEPFNRLGRERGTVEGTGIGLHLTRQLVLRMGGTIVAESRLGEGTRVTVRLPRFRAEAAAAPADLVSTPATPGSDALTGSVLYIEDNPVNLMLVEQFLARWPEVQLASAETGHAGLDRLRSERFDLVLLDMQLPDMHGTELLQQLRAGGGWNGTPVVAVSASAMPEAIRAALDAGAVEYWTKPLNLARLEADLRRFLRAAA